MILLNLIYSSFALKMARLFKYEQHSCGTRLKQQMSSSARRRPCHYSRYLYNPNGSMLKATSRVRTRFPISFNRVNHKPLSRVNFSSPSIVLPFLKVRVTANNHYLLHYFLAVNQDQSFSSLKYKKVGQICLFRSQGSCPKYYSSICHQILTAFSVLFGILGQTQYWLEN